MDNPSGASGGSSGGIVYSDRLPEESRSGSGSARGREAGRSPAHRAGAAGITERNACPRCLFRRAASHTPHAPINAPARYHGCSRAARAAPPQRDSSHGAHWSRFGYCVGVLRPAPPQPAGAGCLAVTVGCTRAVGYRSPSPAGRKANKKPAPIGEGFCMVGQGHRPKVLRCIAIVPLRGAQNPPAGGS